MYMNFEYPYYPVTVDRGKIIYLPGDKRYKNGKEENNESPYYCQGKKRSKSPRKFPFPYPYPAEKIHKRPSHYRQDSGYENIDDNIPEIPDTCQDQKNSKKYQYVPEGYIHQLWFPFTNLI